MSADRWRLARGWLPLPPFVFALLGEDGSRAFSETVREASLPRAFLVGFALETEHHNIAIETVEALEKAIARVFSPDYDFGPASALMSSESSASQDRRATEFRLADAAALEFALSIPDSPAAFERALKNKQLPLGRAENIALMREILSNKN